MTERTPPRPASAAPAPPGSGGTAGPPGAGAATTAAGVAAAPTVAMSIGAAAPAPALLVEDNGDWIETVIRSTKPSSLVSRIKGRRQTAGILPGFGGGGGAGDDEDGGGGGGGAGVVASAFGGLFGGGGGSGSSARSASATVPSAGAASRRRFMKADVLHEGELLKQGSWRRNWKRRHFILRRDTKSVCYYSAADNLTLLGEVPLTPQTEVWSIEPSAIDGMEHVFAVGRADKEPLLLKAYSLAERETWMSKIIELSMAEPSSAEIDSWMQLFGNAPLIAPRRGGSTPGEPVTPASGNSGLGGARAASNTTAGGTPANASSSATTPKKPQAHVSPSPAMATTALLEDESEHSVSPGPAEPTNASAAENSSSDADHRHVSSPPASSTQQQQHGQPTDPLATPLPLPSASQAPDEQQLQRTRIPSIDDPLELRSVPSSAAAGAESAPAGSLVLAANTGMPTLKSETSTGTTVSTRSTGSTRSTATTVTLGSPQLQTSQSLTHSKQQHPAIHADTSRPHSVDDPTNVASATAAAATAAAGASGSNPSTTDEVAGIKLAVNLVGLCEANDHIFVVVLGGRAVPGGPLSRTASAPSASAAINGGGGGEEDRDKTATSGASSKNSTSSTRVQWEVINRTEVLTVDADAEADGDASLRVPMVRDFSVVVVGNPLHWPYSHIMFRVYRLVTGRADKLDNHEQIAYMVCPKSSLIKSTTLRVKLQITQKPQLDLGDPLFLCNEKPEAFLGVVHLASPYVSLRRPDVANLCRVPPYAERVYSFRTNTAEALCLEQLFAMDFSVRVPRALLHLLIQERLPTLHRHQEALRERLRSTLVEAKSLARAANSFDLGLALIGNESLAGIFMEALVNETKDIGGELRQEANALREVARTSSFKSPTAIGAGAAEGNASGSNASAAIAAAAAARRNAAHNLAATTMPATPSSASSPSGRSTRGLPEPVRRPGSADSQGGGAGQNGAANAKPTAPSTPGKTLSAAAGGRQMSAEDSMAAVLGPDFSASSDAEAMLEAFERACMVCIERVQSLKTALTHITEAVTRVEETYQNCLQLYEQSVHRVPYPGAAIPPAKGGSYLKRSTWKTVKQWQFCATNLNVQLLHTQLFPISHLTSQVAPADAGAAAAAAALAHQGQEASARLAAQTAAVASASPGRVQRRGDASLGLPSRSQSAKTGAWEEKVPLYTPTITSRTVSSNGVLSAEAELTKEDDDDEEDTDPPAGPGESQHNSGQPRAGGPVASGTGTTSDTSGTAGASPGGLATTQPSTGAATPASATMPNVGVDTDEDADAREDAEFDRVLSGATEVVDVFPWVTFGCMAAQSLGFSSGGLRRLIGVAPDAKAQHNRQPSLNGAAGSAAANAAAEGDDDGWDDNRVISGVPPAPPAARTGRVSRTEWLRLLQWTGGVTDKFLEFLEEDDQRHLCVGPLANQKWSTLAEKAMMVATAAKLAFRVDMVASQALSVALCTFYSLLSVATLGVQRYKVILARVLEVGFLCGVESLLSTQGSELGMLEDMSAAIMWLNCCFIRVVRKRNSGAGGAGMPIPEDRVRANSDTEDSLHFSESDEHAEPGAPSNTSSPDTSHGRRRSATSAPNDVASSGGTHARDGDVRADAGAVEEETKMHDPKDTGYSDTSGTASGAATRPHSASGDRSTNKRAALRFPPGQGKNLTAAGQVGDHPQQQQQQKQQQGDGARSSRIGSHDRQGVSNPGIDRFVGHGNGIHVKRTPNGGLIVDIELQHEGQVRTIREALAHCYSPEVAAEAERESENCPWGEVLCVVPLTAVMFSQGINEKQTLSNLNLTGESSLQSQLNLENLLRLEDYYHHYRNVALAQALKLSKGRERATKREVMRLDQLLTLVRRTLSDANAAAKNVNVLLRTADLCRALSGVHAICCKSGKDRTSMAVTLEQARELVDKKAVVDGKGATRLFRLHGVRRQNVKANTEQPNYAFNQLQFQCLPKCYRPPAGTYSGKVVT